MQRHRSIEGIATHRMFKNRRNSPTQDGRPLRRYRRRWKVERLFAWLYQFRRIVTRGDHRLEQLGGFVHLSCLIILLRHS